MGNNIHFFPQKYTAFGLPGGLPGEGAQVGLVREVITNSMKSGRDALALDRLFVVFPGEERFPMDDRIEAIGIERLPELCAEILGL